MKVRNRVFCLALLLILLTARPFPLSASSLSLRDQAVQIALEAGLPPGLFCRLIEKESDWDPWAVSASGCVGLGQINQEAWRWWPDDPFDPLRNLAKSAEILQWNVAYRIRRSPELSYVERWQLAVASYNMGHGRVNDLLAEHGEAWRGALPETTRRYVTYIVGGD